MIGFGRFLVGIQHYSAFIHAGKTFYTGTHVNDSGADKITLYTTGTVLVHYSKFEDLLCVHTYMEFCIQCKWL